MVYKVIGLMSGSSLDGLDIAYVHLQETVAGAGTADRRNRKWEYQFQHSISYPYSEEWKKRLAGAGSLSALDYQILHVEYGRYLGQEVQRFITENGLDYQVQLIVSHGHTAFHLPGRQMTAQLGDGAALAAATSINVVSDLRSMDVALGGQGAPIVPIGEQLLFQGYDLFLNLGGIANISAGGGLGAFVAFDVCACNRVLNELAALKGKDYDEGGRLAAEGVVDQGLLKVLNALPYYAQEPPKSLANEFGTDTVLPMVKDRISQGVISVEDALRTYTEHAAIQIAGAGARLIGGGPDSGADTEVTGGEVLDREGNVPVIDGGTLDREGNVPVTGGEVLDRREKLEVTGDSAPSRRVKMLVTGGGAHNTFLVERLEAILAGRGVELVIPDEQTVNFKEALVMALIGVLRWREENNVLASVTGARRDSIGGAVWIGQ